MGLFRWVSYPSKTTVRLGRRRDLCHIHSHLSRVSLKISIHLFATFRLEQCHSLSVYQFSLSKTTFRNYVAHPLSRCNKDTTPILRSLHRLLIIFRTRFKILLLHAELLPSPYLSDSITHSQPKLLLRPHSWRMGDRALPVIAPKLPTSIRFSF